MNYKLVIKCLIVIFLVPKVMKVVTLRNALGVNIDEERVGLHGMNSHLTDF